MLEKFKVGFQWMMSGAIVLGLAVAVAKLFEKTGYDNFSARNYKAPFDNPWRSINEAQPKTVEEDHSCDLTPNIPKHHELGKCVER